MLITHKHAAFNICLMIIGSGTSRPKVSPMRKVDDLKKKTRHKHFNISGKRSFQKRISLPLLKKVLFGHYQSNGQRLSAQSNRQ